jgi:hypothetical protein
MKAIYLFLPLLVFALMINSCSAGEDLEKQVFNDGKKPVSDNQNKSSELAADQEYNEDNLDTQNLEGDETESLYKIESLKIVSISDQDLRSGFKVEVKTGGTDAEIDEFRIVWMHNSEELIGESEETLDWSEDFKKGDKIKVALIPRLGDVESPLVVESEFIIPNSPPKIVSEPPLEIKDGKFDYTVEAEDPDGEDVEFLLRKSPKGMTIEPASGLISWDFTQEKPGTEYKIEIVATDPDGLSYTQELTLTIPEQQPTSEDETEGHETQ